MRSKKSWGYEDSFMLSIAHDMRVHREQLEREHAIVAEDGEGVVGYALMRVDDEHAVLRDLFIEPRYIRKGIGTMLLHHMLTFARNHGAKRVSLVSDPHATKFYERHGFVWIGQEASAYVAGRFLPVMAHEL
jgi:GNAT superfamily N-acetyltransferase